MTEVNWDVMKFQQDLGRLLGDFHKTLDQAVGINMNSPYEDNLKKIIGFDPLTYKNCALSKVAELENTLREYALAASKNYGREISLREIDALFPKGAIQNEILISIEEITGFLFSIKGVAIELESLIRNNSGFWGGLRGLFGGYKDPTGEIARGVDVQTQYQVKRNEFTSIAVGMASANDRAVSGLKRTVLGNWNQGMSIICPE